MQTGPSTTIECRLEAVHQRGGVDVGLERGAGLAHRVDGAVELAGAVIAAADHGAHAAVEIGEHGCGLRRVIVAAELAQQVLDRRLRGALHVRCRSRCAPRTRARCMDFGKVSTSLLIWSKAQSR